MSACADAWSRFFKRGAATSLEACNCLCATHSAPRGLFRTDVATGSPDGSRKPRALACAWTAPWTLYDKTCAPGMWASAVCRARGFRASQWP
eukprot:4071906-Prymnesium_polylepis.1